MGQIIIILLLLFGAYVGWRNGLVRELTSMVGFLLGLWLAWKFYGILGGGVTVFLILWFIVPIAFGLLARVFTKALDFTIVGGILNRVLGMLVGMGKWAILIFLAIKIIDKVNEWRTLLENL